MKDSITISIGRSHICAAAKDLAERFNTEYIPGLGMSGEISWEAMAAALIEFLPQYFTGMVEHELDNLERAIDHASGNTFDPLNALVIQKAQLVEAVYTIDAADCVDGEGQELYCLSLNRSPWSRLPEYGTFGSEESAEEAAHAENVKFAARQLQEAA